MTKEQIIRTIGLDLKRIAHCLLTGGSKRKIDYFVKEISSLMEKRPDNFFPKKIKPLISMIDFSQLNTLPSREAAENFLTAGSLICSRLTQI